MVYEPSTERELDIIKHHNLLMLHIMEVLEWNEAPETDRKRVWYKRFVLFDNNLADEAYWSRKVPN